MTTAGDDKIEAPKIEALWALREGDAGRLRMLVEKKGVRVTDPAPDGTPLIHDISALGTGPAVDYLWQQAAFENASVIAAPRAQNTQAPAAASFRKRGPHGPG